MRVTIVSDDNAVIVNGERHTVDCSSLPADFHALQWNETKGEIEYRLVQCDHCGARSKKGNEFITDLSPYMKFVDAWQAALAAHEAQVAAALAAHEAEAEKAKTEGAQAEAAKEARLQALEKGQANVAGQEG